MAGYMFDTNIFNRILAEDLAIARFGGGQVFATHVQRDELGRTRSDEKRAELLATFREINPAMMPTSSAVWGDSNWGESRWSDGELLERLQVRLRELDEQAGKKLVELNQSRDARIAETAILQGMTLVTCDKNLSTVTVEFGGRTVDLAQFMAEQVSGR